MEKQPKNRRLINNDKGVVGKKKIQLQDALKV